MSPPRLRTAAAARVLRCPSPAALLAATPPPPRGRPRPIRLDRLGSPPRSTVRYLVEDVVARAHLDAHPRLERDAALTRIVVELERFCRLFRFFATSLLLLLLLLLTLLFLLLFGRFRGARHLHDGLLRQLRFPQRDRRDQRRDLHLLLLRIPLHPHEGLEGDAGGLFLRDLRGNLQRRLRRPRRTFLLTAPVRQGLRRALVLEERLGRFLVLDRSLLLVLFRFLHRFRGLFRLRLLPGRSRRCRRRGRERERRRCGRRHDDRRGEVEVGE